MMMASMMMTSMMMTSMMIDDDKQWDDDMIYHYDYIIYIVTCEGQSCQSI